MLVKEPKISVITVTYNCRSLLKNTIESIGNQCFKDIEHIVIDGASTDGTIDVIRQQENRNAYWISEEDKGIYDAMNKGLKVATGDYVLFLNAGDTFYDKNTLNNIQFSKFPAADIFYGETLILDANGKQVGLRRKKLPVNLNWKHFKRGMVVCHQSILVRREIVSFYDPKYLYAADIEWVLSALKKSKQIIFTNSIISNFVEGGFSNQNLVKSWIERFIILRAHFGLLISVYFHVVLIVENMFVRLKILPQFRKVNL